MLTIKDVTLIMLAVVALVAAGGCGDSDAAIRANEKYRLGFKEGYGKGLATDADYHQGFEHGYEHGFDNGKLEGSETGYEKGFTAARPGHATEPPTTLGRRLQIVVVILACAKVIVALLTVTTLLIFDSDYRTETVGKSLVAVASFLVLMWLMSSFTVGFTEPLRDVLYLSGQVSVGRKLIWGLGGAIVMFGFLLGAEHVLRCTAGHHFMQGLCVFVLSFATATLLPVFISLHHVPNLGAYLIVDIVWGVLVGGILYVAFVLLDEKRIGHWLPSHARSRESATRKDPDQKASASSARDKAV